MIWEKKEIGLYCVRADDTRLWSFRLFLTLIKVFLSLLDHPRISHTHFPGITCLRGKICSLSDCVESLFDVDVDANVVDDGKGQDTSENIEYKVAEFASWVQHRLFEWTLVSLPLIVFSLRTHYSFSLSLTPSNYYASCCLVALALFK